VKVAGGHYPLEGLLRDHPLKANDGGMKDVQFPLTLLMNHRDAQE
jgi:hypothetical protein